MYQLSPGIGSTGPYYTAPGYHFPQSYGGGMQQPGMMMLPPMPQSQNQPPPQQQMMSGGSFGGGGGGGGGGSSTPGPSYWDQHPELKKMLTANAPKPGFQGAVFNHQQAPFQAPSGGYAPNSASHIFGRTPYQQMLTPQYMQSLTPEQRKLALQRQQQIMGSYGR